MAKLAKNERLGTSTLAEAFKDNLRSCATYWRTFLLVFSLGAVSASLHAPWYLTLLVCIAAAFALARVEAPTEMDTAKKVSDVATRLFMAAVMTYLLFQTPHGPILIEAVQSWLV